jgi:hypothetical protein
LPSLSSVKKLRLLWPLCPSLKTSVSWRLCDPCDLLWLFRSPSFFCGFCAFSRLFVFSVNFGAMDF